MKPILLSTDGSPTAARATTFAIELAEATGWPLHVLCAWVMPVTYFGEIPDEKLAKLRRTSHENAANVVQEAVDAAEARGVEAEGNVVYGDPVTEICAAAQEAQLVILGAHGWGPVKRLVYGSVSSSVLHEAPCPVLVVRADVEAVAEIPAFLASA
jgi:nucleotide-binding universal stress UspA family protein